MKEEGEVRSQNKGCFFFFISPEVEEEQILAPWTSEVGSIRRLKTGSFEVYFNNILEDEEEKKEAACRRLGAWEKATPTTTTSWTTTPVAQLSLISWLLDRRVCCVVR